MIRLTIDGKTICADEGSNVLEVALQNGIYIPHLCHHPDLPELGSCRLCLVEVEGQDGVHPSCQLLVKDGIVIHTHSERIEHLRTLAMELILSAHPEHCSSCLKFGRCELQLLIQYMDATAARMNRRVKKLPENENPLICHDMQRCVLCGRCVRACKELRGVDILQYNKKELEVYVGTVQNKHLIDVDCRFCGACAEVCPTGAIRDAIGYTAVEKPAVLLPCVAACPAHADIPAYLRYAKAGEYDKANAVIHEKLPFPEVLGRVCDHKCETHCRRGELNDAVSIREVKRVCAQRDTTELWRKNAKQLPDTDKRVAVVGGGPAGLTAALYLKKQGHAVTILEAEEKLGGQLQYGIPAYRLPREVVDRETSYVHELGVDIQCGRRVTDFAALRQAFDAVLVAIGTHSGLRLPIKGAELAGTFTCTEFLRDVSLGEVVGMGKRVCVLGAGDVAFDCARTAVRLGAKQVYLSCRKRLTELRVGREEIERAQQEGIVLLEGRGFDAIVGETSVTGIRLSHIAALHTAQDGKIVAEPVLDSIEELPVDTVIFAVGQQTGLDENCGLALGKNGVVVTKDGSSMTDIDGVFACGDVVTGTKTVVEAIAAARSAASEIDRYLGGDGNIDETLVDRGTPPAYLGHEDGFATAKRNQPRTLTAEESVKSFVSVSDGLCDAASCEAARCLQCDLRLHMSPPRTWTSVQEQGGAE